MADQQLARELVATSALLQQAFAALHNAEGTVRALQAQLIEAQSATAVAQQQVELMGALLGGLCTQAPADVNPPGGDYTP